MKAELSSIKQDFEKIIKKEVNLNHKKETRR
jgi:hypothetical protein